MKSSELLRKLKRLGAEVIENRGKGGHVLVRLNGKQSIVQTSTDLPKGTFHGFLKQLDLKPEDL